MTWALILAKFFYTFGNLLYLMHTFIFTINFIMLKYAILGHLLFEMCCGYELTSVMPTEQDYKCAKKDDVKDILQFVFGEDQIEHVHTKADRYYEYFMLLFLSHYRSGTISSFP